MGVCVCVCVFVCVCMHNMCWTVGSRVHGNHITGRISQVKPIKTSCKHVNCIKEVCVLYEYHYVIILLVVVIVYSLKSNSKQYMEYDPQLVTPFPSNPWITGSTMLWSYKASL